MIDKNLNESKTKKCFVVARTATKNPEKNNVEKQVRWAEVKAEELDAEIAVTLSVNGMSAHRFTDEYMNIIIDIVQKEKINYLLVHDYSRLCRDFSKEVSIVKELINCGCDIVMKHTVIDSDSFNDSYRKIRLALTAYGDAE